MKKITLLFFLLIAFPCAVLNAQEVITQESIQDEEPEIIITVTDNTTVRIQNAPVDSVMEVYNIVGVKVTSEKIDSSDKTVTLNLSKGYYILKIENVVRKIVIK